jgi:hypothetical protein
MYGKPYKGFVGFQDFGGFQKSSNGRVRACRSAALVSEGFLETSDECGYPVDPLLIESCAGKSVACPSG